MRALGSLDSWGFSESAVIQKSDTVIGLPGHPLQTYQYKQLRDALLFAITHWYAMRLNLDKTEFRDAVCRCWSWARFKDVDNEFFATPKGEDFWKSYDYITGFIVNQLHNLVSITRNDTIRENMFALFVGTCTTFIVGKPGTSKSLLLTGRTAAAEATEAFF